MPARISYEGDGVEFNKGPLKKNIRAKPCVCGRTPVLEVSLYEDPDDVRYHVSCSHLGCIDYDVGAYDDVEEALREWNENVRRI